NSYTWFDPSPVKGDNFYRLKSVDKNGTVQFSSIIKITLGVAEGSIKVFPNPVVDKTISIQLNNVPAGDYTFSLYSVTGKRIYSGRRVNTGKTNVIIMNTNHV